MPAINTQAVATRLGCRTSGCQPRTQEAIVPLSLRSATLRLLMRDALSQKNRFCTPYTNFIDCSMNINVKIECGPTRSNCAQNPL